jgi:hypothetical protein
MRFLGSAIAILVFVAPVLPQTAPAAEVFIGTWEGESKCTLPDSPCRDEHLVYRIAAGKKPGQLTIDADKIVNGSPQFMGTIVCEIHAAQATLSCTGDSPKKDDWQFHVAGDTMTGTLTVGAEKQLYRRIAVRKTTPKTN